MLTEKKYFPYLKCSFAILSLIAFVNLIISCWWLRNIEWDGSRFAFNLVNSLKPYFEFRPLHALFQIPTIILGKIFPSLGPLSLTRIYLYSITLPIYTWMINKILRSKKTSDLIPPFALLIVGYIPGITFALSSVLETTFFFIVMLDSILNQRKVTFYITALLVTFGHPAVLPGLLLIMLILLHDQRKHPENENHKYIAYLFVMLLIGTGIIISICVLGKNADLIENLKYVFEYYKRGFWNEEILNIHICTIFSLLLLSDFLRKPWRQIIEVSLGALIIFLLLKFTSSHPFNITSYCYRMWTAGLTYVIAIYMWGKKRWIPESESPLVAIILLITASLYVLKDFQISELYKAAFENTKSVSTSPGCHQVFLNHPSPNRRMTLPVFKIIVDNKWDVNSLIVNHPNPKFTRACSEIFEDENKITIPMYPFRLSIVLTKNGKFEFSEDILR